MSDNQTVRRLQNRANSIQQVVNKYVTALEDFRRSTDIDNEYPNNELEAAVANMMCMLTDAINDGYNTLSLIQNVRLDLVKVANNIVFSRWPTASGSEADVDKEVDEVDEAVEEVDEVVEEVVEEVDESPTTTDEDEQAILETCAKLWVTQSSRNGDVPEVDHPPTTVVDIKDVSATALPVLAKHVENGNEIAKHLKDGGVAKHLKESKVFNNTITPPNLVVPLNSIPFTPGKYWRDSNCLSFPPLHTEHELQSLLGSQLEELPKMMLGVPCIYSEEFNVETVRCMFVKAPSWAHDKPRISHKGRTLAGLITKRRITPKSSGKGVSCTDWGIVLVVCSAVSRTNISLHDATPLTHHNKTRNGFKTIREAALYLLRLSLNITLEGRDTWWGGTIKAARPRNDTKIGVRPLVPRDQQEKYPIIWTPPKWKWNDKLSIWVTADWDAKVHLGAIQSNHSGSSQQAWDLFDKHYK